MGILRNENYIGNTVYNRESNTLREGKVKNPPSQWIRTEGSIEPAIDKETFLRAQERMTLRWEELTDDEMLDRLRRLLTKAGRLNQTLIESTLGVPSCSTYASRFGSMREAYRRIGYRVRANLDWIERRDEHNALLRSVADDLSAKFERAGLVACFDPTKKLLTIDDRIAISLRLARFWLHRRQNAIWTIHQYIPYPAGHLVAIRLDEKNTNVLDYILLPTDSVPAGKLALADVGWRRRFHCFQSIDELGTAILRAHSVRLPRRRPKRLAGKRARNANPKRRASGYADHPKAH